MWLWLLGAVVLFAVVAAVVILVPLAVVPTGGLTVEKRLTAENNLRTTLVQFAGGSVLLFGTALTLYFNREGQITERFTRAIDQLGQAGGEKLDVRLGGIYALERIARDSTSDRGPIVEVLTAFLRERARWNVDSAPPPAPTDHAANGTGSEQAPRLRADFQAVATILGRNQWSRRYGVDLREVDLRGANLREAHLEGADFSGAHLEGANLSDTHLEGANFRHAHLKAYLSGAHLKGAIFVDAHLEGAYLGGAHLEGAWLTGTHLEKADLTDAHLKGAYLADAHLEGAFLGDAHLERADLGGAHLEGAALRGAHLEGAKLTGAHLEGVSLRDAHLEGANLRDAHLEGAYLGGANLEGVEGLTPAQVELVINLSEAIGVPPGLLGT